MAGSAYVTAGKIVTGRARLSYPWIFTPQPVKKPGDTPKYGCSLIFYLNSSPADLAILQKMKELAALARSMKWGTDKNKWPKGIKSPFHNGDEKGQEEYRGSIYISCNSKQQPELVDRARQPVLDPNKFYAGCYVRASLSCYAYVKDGGIGVAFGLQNMQFLDNGERLGSRTAAEDDFDAVEGAEADKAKPSNVAPTGTAAAASAAVGAAVQSQANDWDDTSSAAEPNF